MISNGNLMSGIPVMHFSKKMFIVLGIAIGLAVIFLVGCYVTTLTERQIPITLTFALILSVAVVADIKPLKPLILPLLLTVALVAGMSSAQWIQPQAQILQAMTIVGVILLGVGVLAWRKPFDFKKQLPVITVLSITFSLVGGLLVYAQAPAWMAMLWVVSALVCFSLLQYNLMQTVFAGVPREKTTAISSSVFLLNLGLLANVGILFMLM